MEQNYLFAFLLTLFAGLSTGIGGVIALFAKKLNVKCLSASLGFSAGVMIYVSFMELLPEGMEALTEKMNGSGIWFALLSFFLGIFTVALIDKLVPSYENPHEVHTMEEVKNDTEGHNHKIFRLGVLSAVVIAFHNFPEGLVTFTGAMKDVSLGITLAIAIAVHNIPEGLSVAVPILYATKSRKKTFIYTMLSGIAEPIGAVAGYFLLSWIFTDALVGSLLAYVAGIMVFISLDQLLPTARAYGEHHMSVYGLTAGMAVMGVSLLLF
ncbi:zinc transporter ZupT [Patescibacteria group bacterium]|nr:zinc transporter ZupT [Patescibacteria group bacterium]